MICNCSGGPCDILTGTCDEESKCPSQCTTCSDSGVCMACLTGFYGPQCDQQCSRVCNDLGCYQNGTCYQCRAVNVYGVFCNFECSSLCPSFTCDRWKGQCHLKCSSLCETCDVSSGKCSKCREPIRYGDRCQNICSFGCANLSCHRTSGECFACNGGIFGSFCNRTCSSSCSSNGCDMEFGKCHACLSQNSYGDFCDKPCSDTCNHSQCDRNGECTSGCVINRYGPRCEFMCSENCNATITGNRCDDQGRCLIGCSPGYKGRDCGTGNCRIKLQT